MARPPLPLGQPGTITVWEKVPGLWAARCRFRDYDGVTRRLWGQGASKTAARSELYRAIEGRQRTSVRAGELTPASRFEEAAELFLEKTKRKRADTTYAQYQVYLNTIALPALGSLRLRECTPGRLSAYFDSLESRYSVNTRRGIRTVVSGSMQQAVLHEAIAANPVRELERIERPKGERKPGPRGLTSEERRRLLDWLDGSSSDPRVLRLQRMGRDADLPDLVRFFLGTGMRIGEALATRRLDVNLDGLTVQTADGEVRVPVVTVAGNIVFVKGKSLVRHEGKTGAALRVIPLPEFAADLVRARLATNGDDGWPLFPTSSPDGRITYRWPSNVRRTLRTVRGELDLDWMTPHTWRRTYATILDDEITLTDRMKADLMGQATFLKATYVSRGELHPGAAVVLDSAIR